MRAQTAGSGDDSLFIRVSSTLHQVDGHGVTEVRDTRKRWPLCLLVRQDGLITDFCMHVYYTGVLLLLLLQAPSVQTQCGPVSSTSSGRFRHLDWSFRTGNASL